jgi:hypothetical protein
MSLLGQAAIAMWWDIRAEQRTEFGDWHSNEHFPERMSIPGFRRGSRWMSTSDTEGFFVLYELDQYQTLTSKEYLDRLNAPTAWSKKMMPHHLNMVRSQCLIEASFGGGVAAFLATVRCSPFNGNEEKLGTKLRYALRKLTSKPGLTGAHLLITRTPKLSGLTTEQKIRGSDGVADWVILLSGYDPDILDQVVLEQFSYSALQPAGANEDFVTGCYKLAFTMTPWDLT